MFDPLLTDVKHFLASHWKKGSPLLVACSGGPDSKAILYLLLKAQKFFNLHVEVAHINHGWRPESCEEAELLQGEICSLGLPFHYKILEEVPAKEEAARKARYDFLWEVGKRIGAQAVVLGHQLEDQAETVLKRILEGASIAACGGMKKISSSPIPLWRPLLSCSKKEIVQWLQIRNIPFFTDITNLDPTYLRGRFRSTILPELEHAFGKSIINNLFLFGERAQEIDQFLSRMAEPLTEQKVADLQQCEEIVLQFFIKKWGEREGLFLSRDQIAILSKKIRAEEGDLSIGLALKNQKVYLY